MKSELKELTRQFLSSKQNANLLPEILASLNAKGGPDLLQSVRSFKTIFTEIIPRGDFNYEAFKEEGSAERQYSEWLRSRYIEGVEDLSKLMQTNGSSKLRDLGLETLISFHELERENVEKFPKLDHNILIRLIEVLLDSELESPLISHSAKIIEFFKQEKIRMDLLNCLQDVLKGRSKSDRKLSEDWMKNVLKLCRTIAKAEANFIQESASTEIEAHRRVFKGRFSRVWTCVMKWDCMTPAIVRLIVSFLPDHIMEHLERPVLMSDFLLESFKIKGPIAVLALRGIFILMLKYNFEVPDFYTKLYSLFTLPVLRSNYRERFFKYSADFLSSSHLPEYLVAAFVKKLARLSLHAPSPVIPIIAQFIVNLIISHPGLKILIHNTKLEKIGSVSDDPFNMDESDPNKTRAMESSLWEMKSLQNHAIPQVAQACSFIEKQISGTMFDLEQVISNDYDELFEDEVSKKKNIEQVEARVFPPFDFELSGRLSSLSDSVFSNKRVKLC